LGASSTQLRMSGRILISSISGPAIDALRFESTRAATTSHFMHTKS